MYDFFKRAFDIGLSALALVILSPIMIITAIAIRLDSPGPAIFRQVRIGRDQRPFTILKYRTMYHGNDDSEHREFMERHVRGESTPRLNDEGSEVYLLNDDRTTRVGRFLRRLSIDELPNLFNVLGGSMSIVGPRPPIPYEVELYDERALQRLTVKPGMTGYAQVKGRGELRFESMVRYDLEYIERRGFLTDLGIILQTIPAVLGRRGV